LTLLIDVTVGYANIYCLWIFEIDKKNTADQDKEANVCWLRVLHELGLRKIQIQTDSDSGSLRLPIYYLFITKIVHEVYKYDISIKTSHITTYKWSQ